MPALANKAWPASIFSLCAQGNYTVNAGSNPVSHMWVLCNPDIPRKTPFVLDLAGSELVFEVCLSLCCGP